MKKKSLIIISLVLFIISPIYSQHPEWQTLPAMPGERYGHCSVVYQDKVWIIGGKDQRNQTIKTIDCYDLISNKWLPNHSELLHARYNTTAVVYENKIFVIGGHNDRQILNSVEYYDPAGNKWKEFTPISNQREGASAVVLNDSLYVFGGISNMGIFPKILDTIEFWDGVSWQQHKTWRLKHARVFMQAVVVDSFIYILGGRFIDRQLGVVERFGKGGMVEVLSPLNIPRFYFSAVKINKMIYVLGGVRDGDFEVLADTIEYYSTIHDSWYLLNLPLLTPRAGLSAVSYNNNIYVFGGTAINFKVLNNAEVLTGVPTDVATAVSRSNNNENMTNPHKHSLLKNYPNPFNSATIISFELAENESQMQLIIFNLRGEKVRTFQLHSTMRGVHQIEWDGRNDAGRIVESGIYLAQLRSDQSCGEILKLSFIK